MKKVLLILAIVFIQGCATAYQKQGFSGGYTETQLDTNVFKVNFAGNGYTGRERASDFALLRCAELTLDNGYNYFATIDSNQSTTNSSYTTPTQTYGTATAYGNTAYGTSTTYGGQTFHISKPSSSHTIVCFKEKPKGFSYNAKFIKKSLKAKYGLVDPIVKKETHNNAVK